MTDKIETERLILRKAKVGDLEKIWKNVWCDERIAKTMLWKPTLTYDDAVSRFARTKEFQKNNYAYFVCLKENDEPIGFAGIKDLGNSEYEETGICISYDNQGKGYGKEVLAALIRLVFDILGGQKFIYGCFNENIASSALCKSCGFTYTHSETCERKWDGYEYVCDFYELQNTKRSFLK